MTKTDVVIIVVVCNGFSLNLCCRCLNKEQNLDDKKMHLSNSGEKHILSEVYLKLQFSLSVKHSFLF